MQVSCDNVLHLHVGRVVCQHTRVMVSGCSAGSRLARKCALHGGGCITRSRSEKKDDSFVTSGVRGCINKIWESVGL